MKTLKYIQPRLVAFFTFLALFAGTSTINAQQTEAAAQTQAAEELEEIVGIVCDAATKEVLAGVRVEALNNNRYTAMTKPDGTFSIKIPAHVASLFVSTPGYENVIIKARQKGGIQVELFDEKFSTFVENGFEVTAKNEAVIDMSKATSLAQYGSVVRECEHGWNDWNNVGGCLPNDAGGNKNTG